MADMDTLNTFTVPEAHKYVNDFETTKLNSDHDKFCLDSSLSNFSKTPLDNNTFAIETFVFLFQ